MADVFVSYKREDRPAVQRLVKGLRAEGLDVWWDQDIPPEAPWEATVERELLRSKAVIVMWSPRAVTSDSVKAEARRARNEGRLIQVFVEPCEPPLFFGEHQGVDLSNWRGNASEERFRALASATRAILAGERPADAVGFVPQKQPTFMRYAAGVAVACNVLAILPAFGAATATGEAPLTRQELLAKVAGSWGNVARDGEPGCSTVLTYAVERRGADDYVVVSADGFSSEARVASAEGFSVFTRTVKPAAEAGMQWELRIEGDRLIQVDKDNTSTTLVRC